EVKIARVGIWKCTGAAENSQAGWEEPFRVRVSCFEVGSWISSTGGHFGGTEMSGERETSKMSTRHSTRSSQGQAYPLFVVLDAGKSE
ncbi:hypothetical protein PAXRUDRAFT_830391, partial [Paxillus rubicundulus Ve08.2h10]